MTNAPARRIVIGVGNPDRGDDAAGRNVAKLLRGLLPADVDILEHDGETGGLIAYLEGAATAFLVDACASGAPAGTVRRFDLAARRLPPDSFGLSSHGLGLAEAVELARRLDQLPSTCVLYAIEGESFATGAPMSAPVARAVADVATRLCGDIGEVTGAEGQKPCQTPDR